MRIIIVSIFAALIAFSSIANAATICCCFKTETGHQISEQDTPTEAASAMPCHEAMQADSDIEKTSDCEQCGCPHASHSFTVPAYPKLSYLHEQHYIDNAPLAAMNAFEPEQQPQPPKTHS